MNRPLIVGIVGALIVAAAIAVTFFLDAEPDRPGLPGSKPVASATDREPAAPGPLPDPSARPGPAAGGGTAAPGTPPETTAAGAARKPAAPPAADAPPSFDIVRVNPQGDAVIAGRAAPDSEVTVTEGDKVIGTVRADKRGEWVLVPAKPLPAGSHELQVTTRDGSGTVRPAERKVVVAVPGQGQGKGQGQGAGGKPSGGPDAPLAVAVPRQGTGVPWVLQSPGGAEAPAGGLTLEVIDYGDTGDLGLSGRAPPGTEVRVYLDNRFIGAAAADDKGVWILKPDVHIDPGLYRMRVDRVDAAGKVLARIELPFKRAAPIRDLGGRSVVFVQPGNSLWRLARAVYGEGTRYTEIFGANKDQIRDPDLIYPGQVFVLPAVN